MSNNSPGLWQSAIQDSFTWTLSQATRNADECFSQTTPTRRIIAGVQYNTGEHNLRVQLNLPIIPVGQVSLIKFGPETAQVQGTYYYGALTSTFIGGYMSCRVDADQRIKGVFTSVLHNVLPGFIVGVFNIDTRPGNPGLIQEFPGDISAKHEESLAPASIECPSPSRRFGVFMIYTNNGGQIHTLDTDADYSADDHQLVLTARFGAGAGPMGGQSESITFRVKGDGARPSGAITLPSDSASLEYELDNVVAPGNGCIEDLAHDEDSDGWYGHFRFDAYSNTFQGIFQIFPNAGTMDE